jgi:hypothetical protein
MSYIPSLFSIPRNIQISLKITKDVNINFAILYNLRLMQQINKGANHNYKGQCLLSNVRHVSAYLSTIIRHRSNYAHLLHRTSIITGSLTVKSYW